MATASITLDTKEIRRVFQLADHGVRRVMSKAINRTSFEILDAEKDEARENFTLRRLRPSFRFDAAKPERLEAHIMPLPLTEEFLGQHVEGGQIDPGEGPDRILVGRRKREFAVPIRARRGRSGRFGKRDTPADLLKPGGRGFAAEGVIFRRFGRGRSQEIVPMFALVPSVHFDQRLDYYGVAQKTAQRHFNTKAIEEFRRARFGR